MITVDICGPDWKPQGRLGGYSSLRWTETLFDVGTGSTTIPTTEYHRDLVQIGNTVVVRDTGRLLAAGYLKFGEKDSATNGLITLAWQDLNVLLQDRLAYQDPAHEAGQQTTAYDSRAGAASTIIRDLIEVNAGYRAIPDRQSGIVCTTDPVAGAWFASPVMSRMDNLLDVLRKVAVAGGVVFRIDLTNGRGLQADIHAAADLSAKIVFSPAMRTVGHFDWLIDPPTATHLIAGGQGELEERLFVLVPTPDSEDQAKRWGRRIEMFYDNSSAETQEQLIAEAVIELGTHGERLTGKFQPGADADWRYNVDYRLGDQVGCRLRPGWLFVRPIIQVDHQVSATGVVSSTPTAGDLQLESGPRTDASMKAMMRDLSAIQRNR